MSEINNQKWIFNAGFKINTLEEAEVYDSLSREDKMLAEIQKQTQAIKNIEANVQFFFFLITILSIVIAMFGLSLTLDILQ